MRKFDVVIIGSGQGGNPLAHAFAQAGYQTAMIERNLVGGTCINIGCTPSKTLIASGKVAHTIKRSEKYGIYVEEMRVKMSEVVSRKNKVVKSFRDGVEQGLKLQKNITLIKGHARFIEPYRLNVEMNSGARQKIMANRIVIDTGARNRVPEIDGLTSIDFFDSTSIMNIKDVPEHLVIIGGGYNGLEMGQLFLRLGSKVTVIDASKRLLPKEDEDIAAEIQHVLGKEGMKIYVNATIEKVSKQNRDSLTYVFFKQNGGKKKLIASHIMIAAGRIPNTDDLGLEAAGIVTDENGFIKVNGKLETNIENIYAIGDVNGGPAFTHIAYDDFRILKANILDKKQQSTRNRLIPYCMFIDPPLGRVGLSEDQAKQKGIKYKIAKMPMSKVARALETGQSKGLMKVLIDTSTDKILGASILGDQAGELMNMLQIAMLGGLKYQRLRDGVFAHPTYGESLNNLFASFATGKGK
ncbi:dihydrolipoyl dehydrogenase [Arachidicoccus sp.]|uniref:dihydrolipoyl dehydrogenase n=1 Tax=Arachidicoccus sp. TaxID=1872624 RepID=UPI003D198F75